MFLEVHETRSRVHAAAQEQGKLALKKQKPNNEIQERDQNGPSKNKKSADNEGKDREPEVPTKKLKAGRSEPNGREAATRKIAEFYKAIGEHLSSREYEPNGRDAVVPRWN
jgi:poly [ADP-ribose] polymerase 2/3/4